MKLANANKIRKQYIEELLAYFACDDSSDGEDCSLINFKICVIIKGEI